MAMGELNRLRHLIHARPLVNSETPISGKWAIGVLAHRRDMLYLTCGTAAFSWRDCK
jgi:hypothetical protein